MANKKNKVKFGLKSQSWPPLSPCSFAAVTVRNAPKSTVALQIDSRPPSFLMLLRIW